MTAASDHACSSQRLKYAAQLRRDRPDDLDADGRPYIGLEQIESNTGRLVRTSNSTPYDVRIPPERSTGTTFECGDVLFGKLRPYLAKAWVAEFPGRCTTELLTLRPQDVDARFLLYVLLSPDFVHAVDASTFGSKMPRAEWDFIGNLPIPLPAIQQQRAIADYLDRETARLDGLVAEKRRILRLLAERRRALVTQAVTRGLDPNAPMRDSAVPWLGRIPVHWRTIRLRFLANRIEQGWSPPAENRGPSVAEWGVLKLNAVNQGRFDDTAAKAISPHTKPRTDLEIHAGDFLMTRSNTPLLVGDVCFVETARPRLMLCDIIYRLGLRDDLIDGGFLAYFLGLPVGRCQIEADAHGTSASMVKISQEDIKDWWIPVPPKAEQQEIIRELGVETERLNAARTATDRTITLLKERRAALVAAAVTGQIDVAGTREGLAPRAT